jgi:hypothetical protein
VADATPGGPRQPATPPEPAAKPEQAAPALPAVPQAAVDNRSLALQDDDKIVSSVPLAEGDVDADDLEKRNKARRGEQEITLRKHYAFWILGVMIAEVLSIMGFFAANAIGTFSGCISTVCAHFTFHVSDDLFKAYMYAASGVFGVGLWVTRSLFPGDGKGTGFLDFVLALFGKKRD